MECVKSNPRTGQSARNSRDLADHVFSINPAKRLPKSALRQKHDGMFAMVTPGSPPDAGSLVDMIRSRNIILGARANAMVTLRLPVRGGHHDCTLTYVAGRVSFLRLADGTVIDIAAKCLTRPAAGVPNAFEDLGPHSYRLVLDCLTGLNSILAP
jgi:hypothetical protein